MARKAKTARKSSLATAVTGAVLPAVLAACLTGCGGGSSHDDASPAPAPSGTPGRVEASANGSVVSVTDAVAHLDASGDGTLTMTVKNSGTVADHLDMVGAPGGARGTLTGGRDPKADGAMNTAGILVQADGGTTFGAKDGPTVALHHVTGVSGRHTLPLILQFGVAGLVRLQARVTG
ncbi:hypothetical protein [Streptomyces fuscigenes]|uniref:hypothetical protein n=1 Tax=Streptomyces fuscigenes TaxID=1528880 RepID=UPI001F3CD5D8|nr:hypothetical protein [Streptomyces fuscigenes]MCF3961862.1 hypothetical protein [Streptomyces fuscigenes]